MSQLYSRVFLQILESSIAEDFTVRHVFEDLLKLCDHKNGVVDMTRQALSRRLNIPLDILEQSIKKLESPDQNSRDQEHEGRRIEKLDEHRDWGWRILNWAKYDAIKTRADVAIRVAAHRAGIPSFQKPALDEVKLQCAKIGLPDIEAEKFYDYYESNGWKVGRNSMRNWTSALANWKRNIEKHGFVGKKKPRSFAP